ncbi:hypothetical protein B0H19DRAFT_1333147 [Mycena capillaripes]|nr:hypothetical protein B0H19DRAFT_1333147 [Mycena capillaripes]
MDTTATTRASSGAPIPVVIAIVATEEQRGQVGDGKFCDRKGTLEYPFGNILSWAQFMFIGQFFVFIHMPRQLLVYPARPRALNIGKYQTFYTPWRYRRDHVSHMRLDRLQRACQHIGQPSSGAYKTAHYLSNLMPVFGGIAAAGTIALVREDGTVVNELCWEQGAINPDGTSKSADNIDFGQTTLREPRRGKDKLFQAAMQIEGEVLSDDDQQSKKRKGKEKENSDPDESYSADVGEDSDSDPEAIITHEQLVDSLPTKTIPEGAPRRSKDSVDNKPRRKKRKIGKNLLCHRPCLARLLMRALLIRRQRR